MKIFEGAMKMEIDGKEYYEKLYSLTKDKGLKKIFKMLAEDEQKHYDIVKSMKSNEGEDIQSSTLRDANNIFAKMLEDVKGDYVEKSQIVAYEHACELEDQSIEFYKRQLKNAETEKEKNILEKLAEEEKKHKLILENVIEFIHKPEKTRAVKTEDSDPEFARNY